MVVDKYNGNSAITFKVVYPVYIKTGIIKGNKIKFYFFIAYFIPKLGVEWQFLRVKQQKVGYCSVGSSVLKLPVIIWEKYRFYSLIKFIKGG